MSSKFWDRVDRRGPDECWLWVGPTHGSGYGAFRLKGGPSINAHRVAYILTHGEIPSGLLVCHACDTPLCCNPAHLWLGTNADNVADRVAKGRSKTKLTEDDVRDIRDMPAYGFSQYQIASVFGVRQPAVSRIITGKRRAHLAGGSGITPVTK